MEHTSPESNNSPLPLTPEQESYIEELDTLFIDPEVAEVLEHAEQYEEELHTYQYESPRSIEETTAARKQYMTKLNTEWPYLNNMVEINGWVRRYDSTLNTVEKVAAQDINVVSRGFAILVDSERDDMSENQPRQRMFLRFSHYTEAGESTLFAYPDDVFIQSEIMSRSYAESLLRLLYPERFDDMNRRYDEAPKTELDKVQALATMGIESELDTTSAKQYIRANEICMESLLDLETELPYRIAMNGVVFKQMSDGTFQSINRTVSRHELVQVERVKYIYDDTVHQPENMPGNQKRFSFTPALEVKRYGGGKNTKPETWYYPLETIRVMENIRCMARGYNGEDA